MSVEYCNNCNKYIDTDYNCEHFDNNGKCIYETNNPNNITPNLRNTN